MARCRSSARICIFLAAALLIAELVTVARRANAREVSAGVFGQHVVPSAETVTYGQVRAGGRPKSGAVVDLVAWPSAGSLSRLTSGEVVPTLKLGRSVAASDGTFAVKVDPRAVPAAYLDPNGTVNFDVVVSDSLRQVTYSSSTVATASGWRAASATQVNQRARVIVNLDPTATVSSVDGTVRVDRDGSLGEARTHTVPVIPRSDSFSPMDPDPVSCHWVANGTSRPGSTEHWADIFGWVGAKATVEETTGTSHGLGVALQVGAGSWGPSGSSTLDEATGTGRSEPNVWDVSVHNRVNYTGYTYACAPHPVEHKLMATGTYSLLSGDTDIPHWIGTGCQIYNSGTYWKDSVSNATYGTGVTLAGVIEVSAHAGWTSTTKTEWVFTSSTRVCGNSTSGPDASWKVEAHANS